MAADPMAADPASPRVAGISRRTMARGLALDVGLPVVTYYVLHAAGVSNWFALLAATLVAGARIVLVAIRQRVLNALAFVMLVIYGLGLALTFATGDVRFLVLKDSIGTGVLGLLFLCFALAGHPLTLAATRTWAPERAAAMAERYRTEPAVRHGHFVASMVWGVGLLAEALVRVLLVFLLPISVVVGLSTALAVLVIGSLTMWTGWYIRRARRTLGVQARPAGATSP
ncbi:MAG TPA: VC0807 family protein [Blastococcus sp.]